MSSTYPAAPSTNAYSPHTHAHSNGQSQSMDARQTDYAQPGLSLPYTQPQLGQTSEEPSADQASAAQYSQGQDVKFNPSATPTSEYGMTPQSARQTHFPEYAQRPPYPDQRYQASAGQHPNMAHPQSPCQPLVDGPAVNHEPSTSTHSDHDIPVDPSIAAASPTNYPPQPPHYPPPYPQHDMGHYQPPMYARPGDYPPHAYGHPYPGHYGPPPMMAGRPGPPGVSCSTHAPRTRH